MTKPLAVLQETVASVVVPLDRVALRAVDRAVSELRRGEPVVLEAEDGPALVATVEGLEQDRLDALSALAGAEPALAVTRTRAAALGIEQDHPAFVLSCPGGIAVERVRGLVDPLAPAAGVEGLAAAGTERGSRAGAAVALAKLARLLPAALVLPLRPGAAAALGERHGLVAVGARAILDYQTHAARTLAKVGEARVPLADAEDARVFAFRPADGGVEHLAIVIGSPDPEGPVLARIHSECFTGDLLGSLRCDCGDQLRGAIREIARHGSGVVLYLAQEGRGIGLVNKLRAYRLQDQGFDTVDANERLGFEPDERVYLPAAEMLRGLGYGSVRLMTNNPDKMAQLARCGIRVEGRVPHVFASNGHNEAYLRTKAERSGHLF
jgi:GTP cyclohydrolase II